MCQFPGFCYITEFRCWSLLSNYFSTWYGLFLERQKLLFCCILFKEWPNWKFSCNRDEQPFLMLLQTLLYCENNIFEYVLSLLQDFPFRLHRTLKKCTKFCSLISLVIASPKLYIYVYTYTYDVSFPTHHPHLKNRHPTQLLLTIPSVSSTVLHIVPEIMGMRETMPV